MKLLFGTSNECKLEEVRGLLNTLPFEVVSLKDFPPRPPVFEDGMTFAANAVKKAREYFEATGVATIADDSGLCVDALSGAPGVLSARYAMSMTTTMPGSPKARDRANNAKLLDAMKGLPADKRGAEFRCTLALVTSLTAEPLVVTGICRGSIGLELKGTEGFGYDPLFEMPGMGKTFAELTREEKGRVSHRAQALEALRPHLLKLSGA